MNILSSKTGRRWTDALLSCSLVIFVTLSFDSGRAGRLRLFSFSCLSRIFPAFFLLLFLSFFFLSLLSPLSPRVEHGRGHPA